MALLTHSVAVVYQMEGGSSGTSLELSGADFVSYQYLRALCLVVCNFPFTWYYARGMQMRYLFHVRDLLLWEQYEYVLSHDVEQTESELHRAREKLQVTSSSLDEERRSQVMTCWWSHGAVPLLACTEVMWCILLTNFMDVLFNFTCQRQIKYT